MQESNVGDNVEKISNKRLMIFLGGKNLNLIQNSAPATGICSFCLVFQGSAKTI